MCHLDGSTRAGPELLVARTSFPVTCGLLEPPPWAQFSFGNSTEVFFLVLFHSLSYIKEHLLGEKTVFQKYLSQPIQLPYLVQAYKKRLLIFF